MTDDRTPAHRSGSAPAARPGPSDRESRAFRAAHAVLEQLFEVWAGAESDRVVTARMGVHFPDLAESSGARAAALVEVEAVARRDLAAELRAWTGAGWTPEAISRRLLTLSASTIEQLVADGSLPDAHRERHTSQVLAEYGTTPTMAPRPPADDVIEGVARDVPPRDGAQTALGLEAWAATLGPRTRGPYLAAVRALREHGIAHADTLTRWRDEALAEGTYASATVRLRMAALRSWAAYALPGAEAAAIAAVELPPQPAGRHGDAVDDDQLRAMLDATASLWPDDVARSVQARAIVRALADCGLTLAELTAARLDDLDAGAGRRDATLAVYGRHTRRAPVPPAALHAIASLHQLVRGSRAGRALVPALSKHRPAQIPDPGTAVSGRTVQAIIARLARAIATETPIEPRALTRRFILCQLDAAGHQPVPVDALARHRSTLHRYRTARRP